jgi:hypothetical protein
MKFRFFLMAAVLTASAGVLNTETSAATPHVLAAKKGANATPARGGGPTTINKKLALSPKTLRFGISIDELSRLYASELDRDYLEVYKRVEPGPRMKELDAEVADKKELIKRNYQEFGSLPSGLDNGPLGPEFTYNNDEAMTKLTLRSGVNRHFFFIGKRLWKIFDEHKLTKKSKLGSSYEEVVEGLGKKLGAKARLREANAAEKRLFDSADWSDGATILRVYDLGASRIALLYVDKGTEESLPKLRAHKSGGKEKLDPSVASVTNDDSEGAAPAPAESKPKKR